MIFMQGNADMPNTGMISIKCQSDTYQKKPYPCVQINVPPDGCVKNKELYNWYSDHLQQGIFCVLPYLEENKNTLHINTKIITHKYI